MPHSSVQEEPKQQLEHYVVIFWKKRANQLTDERTRGSEVLGAQVVLLLAGDFGLDFHHVRGERIVVVSLEQLW